MPVPCPVLALYSSGLLGVADVAACVFVHAMGMVIAVAGAGAIRPFGSSAFHAATPCR